MARGLSRIIDECINKDVKLIMHIFSENLEYSLIKRLGDPQKGMVIFKSNAFPTPLRKMSGRLGGMNWLVNDLKQC